MENKKPENKIYESIMSENKLSGKENLLIAFLVPVILMILIFIVRGIFPFGSKSFLRTDLYHQYAPFFSEFQYKLQNGGSLLYSWRPIAGILCGSTALFYFL